MGKKKTTHRETLIQTNKHYIFFSKTVQSSDKMLI